MSAPSPRNALTVGAVELRRFLRDRSNIFFAFIFPLLLVLVIGLQFGGDANAARVTVTGADSSLRSDLVAELESQDLTVTTAGRDATLEQVARGRTGAGLLVEETDAAAYEAGEPVELEIVPGSGATARTVQQQVRVAVDTLRTERGQLAALTERGVDPAVAEEALARAGDEWGAPTLQVESLDELGRQFAGLGQFDLGASGQLLLFVFLATLAGSATLIDARRLGIIARTLAAPVSATEVLAGQVLGRFTIALVQGGYIMAATTLLFDVDWGTLWLSFLVLVVFSLVASGAAMVLGSVMDNEGAASGLGVGLGLVLAALGGGMMPLELFPDTMRTVAALTPHAWGYEAFADIQRRDAGLAEVLPELGVLLAMAAALLVLGAWLLRRSMARAL